MSVLHMGWSSLLRLRAAYASAGRSTTTTITPSHTALLQTPVSFHESKRNFATSISVLQEMSGLAGVDVDVDVGTQDRHDLKNELRKGHKEEMDGREMSDLAPPAPMSMSTPIQTPKNNTKIDLESLSNAALIERIGILESELKKTTGELVRLTSTIPTIATRTKSSPVSSPTRGRRQQNKPTKEQKQSVDPKYDQRASKPPKVYDPSAYHTRSIALKFSYIGGRYGGYEHANNETSAPVRPTIEEVLWKALKKARLIAPVLSAGADDSYDVVWDERSRADKYGNGKKKGMEKLELVWDGLGYSKCGRTDKGVSAFGQVVGVTVRSNRPKNKKRTEVQHQVSTLQTESVAAQENMETEPEPPTAQDQTDEVAYAEQNWDPIRDELSYVTMLNNILPPDIRILAWCPHPPEGFDARHSCQGRQYKYFFTNPAFCPTPGKPGLQQNHHRDPSLKLREGWLDIDAMRVAAKKLEGLHDFRNLCKIDASKQMPSCERRITYANIEEFDAGMAAFTSNFQLNQSGKDVSAADQQINLPDGPRVYAFVVHGTSFLWHQVRCMAAVLFLIGQGLEKPELIDELLDIQANPRRPAYEMADDAPLVLWDCIFPGDVDGAADGMKWVYAGDEASASNLISKGDGMFGKGGLADALWRQWREAKMQETLAAGLLGRVLTQGDRSSLARGGRRSMEFGDTLSQRVFLGSASAKQVGSYIPAMQLTKMAGLEAQNEKYRASRAAKEEAKLAADLNVD